MGVKGFVLSLDAMYAVLLLSMFMVTFNVATSHIDDIHTLSKTPQDLLSSLEKSNYFTFMDGNDAEVNMNLDAILGYLPSNIDGKIIMEEYSEVSGAIVLQKTYTRQDSDPKDQKIVIRRAVADLDNNKYYLLKLEVWHA